MTNSSASKSSEFAKKTFKGAVWAFPSLSTSLLRFFPREEIKETKARKWPLSCDLTASHLVLRCPKGGPFLEVIRRAACLKISVVFRACGSLVNRTRGLNHNL